ncbi:bifunctional UDP-N-acetylglucosamine diphosphorylase/glucosamine-1-phosphate N-acetyltransferase GlmU [Endozoicomonas sp. GU-1]|uniref:bifunctional UDP-N-acetylglucosamine diphosphorylase/glucosamine-1-phosphate N-acetyltransferase GlmU n=1 Tax=Endozoicomonas sp. GU-1 TaxID=3009078 RepID=UPI0022B3980E|nr:bifunctional UDP-N-acetylglucosamine diphosphorylase/glucosamine-1-phosphate N-acetyltransferase GlmU [Endozoicomonas sp. GU-1]WBA81851.1 bifunctional UDP-N-acetylglucosamine diphosphorylase/glucosamine-1-phosphate N-acetyltransferase GlmU [Endozoicomonas sp. GU-1]WBA84805.1 bifunctional UDP-N-acetylglucosamine diphosphorylase/glucosamine-1-phosphate N-acetyltransferase GlmU [Endozoicomonas sp. GU-1]
MRADIVILAAGQGSRMKSKLPKVLHRIAGKPMLEHVILSALHTQRKVGDGKIHVVIGHGAEQVKQALGHYDLNWVVQEEQLGTGHAVQQALPGCKGADVVLVLYGDVPLIHSSSLQSLLAASNGERLGLLTINLANPSGYGRIIRDGFGNIQAIVEDKDASPEQLAINEVNTGIMAIPGNKVSGWVNGLKNENAQHEFYLTDIVSMAVTEDTPVIHVQPQLPIEVEGVNSRVQLMELERARQHQLANNLMVNGVTIIDPHRLDIRGDVKTGHDITLDINVVLEGKVELADNVYIEPGCVIRNSVIGEGAIIKAHSILEDAVVAAGCEVGPFARLRPGTELKEKARVGNFVEIKKTVIGKGSKVNHLSYVGDAEVGDEVNVGAGTITCNYDGVNKFRTVIGDGAFIGSNSSLVAPVTIGRGATTGAGSTITKDIPDDQLAVARGKQRNIEGWQRPVKKD